MATVAQKALLGLSVLLILAGLILTSAGVFSPAWQIVAIREFRAEHQHGLWWDCIRAEKHVVAVGDFYGEAPLHCMYKFDNSAEQVIENTLNNIDEDGAAGESEHHRFWAWHKAVLFFIITSILLAFVSICTGVCAPCFPPTAFCFAISLFIAMIFSFIADGIFFLAANRVDNRFVQGMVGTYEQSIGYAFYLHLLGTFCYLVAFLCAMTTTYKFISGSDESRSKDPVPIELWSAEPHHFPHSINSSDLHFRGPVREEPLLDKPYPPYASQQIFGSQQQFQQGSYRPSPASAYRPTYRETSA